MIGVIPNPKKTFQIEKPVSEVKQAIEHLPVFTSKYILFKDNSTLNQFTFEASEFLSIGVYIDITYFIINELQTEVTIEIRRKIGSFDKSHEISLANTHLSAFTDLISESISTDPTVRLVKMEQIKKDKKDKEDALIQKREEINAKAKVQRENNPFLYYFKLIVIFIIVIGFFAGIVYMITK